jgi:branched-chain amino acid transport system substrate-binding protein
MTRFIVSVTIALGLIAPAVAQQTVKVGVIAPFSRSLVVYGQQYQPGLELYLSEIGNSAGKTKIELVYRDEGAEPERVKHLAEELIVRERVKLLGGLTFTPGALAIAPLSTERRTPTLILNAGTGSITRRSPCFARTSQTVRQGAYTTGDWSGRNGIKSVYILPAEYAPGHDSKDAFETSYDETSGCIVGKALYLPSKTDFAPYIQRNKDARSEAVYLFTRVGPPSVSFVKTFVSLGLKDVGIRLLRTGGTNELELPAMGDAAAFTALYGEDAAPNFAAVAAYDAMHAIADRVAEHGANFDCDAAMATLIGLTSDSPHGRITIDPHERDIIQN